MAKNLNLGYELTFRMNEDGTCTMESSDAMGGGSCWSYLAERPAELFREGRILQTAKGTAIQTGTVLAEDGTGRGVAWKVENVITDADLASWAKGLSAGHQKAAPMLRPLTPQQRYTAVEEANLRMAYSAGWNFSGAVSQAVSDLREGETPCLDRWKTEMARRSA